MGPTLHSASLTAPGSAAAGLDADVAAAVWATEVGVVTAGEVDAVVTGKAATGVAEGAVACDPAAPTVQTLPASQAGAPVRASATRTGTGDPECGPGERRAAGQTQPHDGRGQPDRNRQLGGTDPGFNHVLKCRILKFVNTVLSTHS